MEKGWSPECENGVVGGDEEAESRQQEARRGGVDEARREWERGGERENRKRRRDCSGLYRTCRVGGGATQNRNVIT